MAHAFIVQVHCPIVFSLSPTSSSYTDASAFRGILLSDRSARRQGVGNKASSVRDPWYPSLGSVWMASETGRDSSSGRGIPSESDFNYAWMEAKKISNELMETVRRLLMQEIQKGGFSSAVRVCSELAQEVTTRFSKQTGHYLRRVSLRYRNPKNIPDEYETKRLLEFERFLGEKRLSEEYVEIVEEKGVPYLRYLKPLTVGPLCITCHGLNENIPSEVQAILKERYPEDRATGFLVGDLRGAISVKIALRR